MEHRILLSSRRKKRKVSRKAKAISPPKLRRSFSFLGGAAEWVQDYAIFMLDPEGRILMANRGSEMITGYQRRELLGQHFSLLYSAADRARRLPDAELKETKKTGRNEVEAHRVRKDGREFWANVVITKVLGDRRKIVGFSVVIRDQSARRELEEKLRSSEERLRLLVESVKDYAIFMLDAEGRVASWNPGAERNTGYRADEILGKYFSVFYPERDVATGKCERELREAELLGRYEEEGWRLRKDGSRYWSNVVISAVRDAKGKLVGFSKVTRDLTEKKRAEDKLRHANESLEQRVSERTEDLRVANHRLAQRERELSEAVRVRDEFLSIASHELKTPITSLKIQIQMLQARTRTPDAEALSLERVQKFLGTSLRQVDRLTQLVEDLLDVARAGSRKLAFRFERVDLIALAQEVLDRLRGQADAAGCTLRLDAHDRVTGNFDRFRLDQLLVNLLTNAIKYAPGTTVDLVIRSDSGRVAITVRDGGPGVPPEMRDRIFERFERGGNSMNVGGLGLGLYITREIVRGHRGSIRVHSSADGPGAAFRVDLPTDLPVSAAPESN
jgi:PAS domain S-box-containing protein